MTLKGFVKDKFLIFILLLFGIATIEIFLIPYSFGIFIKVYIPFTIFILCLIGFCVEFFTKKSFYKKLEDILNDLDEKYLVTEIINSPDFLEGKILKNVLEQVDKSMIENVNKYKYIRGRL